MAPRSIEDIRARADEFADAFENYEPQPGDQDAPIPPVMAVKLAAWRRDSAERELADAVRAAREQRLSGGKSVRQSVRAVRPHASVTVRPRSDGMPPPISRAKEERGRESA